MPPAPENSASAPWRSFLKILITIFSAELLIMIAFRRLDLSGQAKDLLDPLVLVALTSPPIYLLVARPLVRGIRQRDQAIEQLRLASTVFENAVEGISICDPDGVITSVNASFTRITGYDAHEAIGKTPRLLKSGRHDALFYAQMWKQITGQGHWQGQVWNRRKDGEIYPEALSITAVRDERGVLTRFVAIFSQAYHDRLTGLANRPMLQEELKRVVKRATRDSERLALLFIDLDGFKLVNDTLGHEVGDDVLREVAEHLQRTIRQSDLAARWGGDEFVVLLSNVRDADSAVAVAHKLLDTMKVRCLADRPELPIGASIGVAVFPQHADDPVELIRQADAAMYVAKAAGKNTVRLAGN